MPRNLYDPWHFLAPVVTKLVLPVIKVVLAILVIGSIVYTTLHFAQVLNEVKSMQDRIGGPPAKQTTQPAK